MSSRSAAAAAAIGGDGSDGPQPLNTRLKIAIVKSGRTQCAIADALRMSPYRLSRIVRGRQVPTPDEEDRLAEYLNQSRRALFKGVA